MPTRRLPRRRKARRIWPGLRQKGVIRKLLNPTAAVNVALSIGLLLFEADLTSALVAIPEDEHEH